VTTPEITKAGQERRHRLLPQGVPRWIRVYDNENRSADRYLVVYSCKEAVERSPGYPSHYPYRAMSENPYHPQGVGIFASTPHQTCDSIPTAGRGYARPPAVGRRGRLGKRINFQDLPLNCRKLVLDDYHHIWRL